jgi:DNA recombination protein RmuC
MIVVALILIGLAVLILLRVSARVDGPTREAVEAIAARLAEFQGATNAGLASVREETSSGGRQAREELARRIDTLAEALGKQVSNGRIESENHAKGLREELTTSFGNLATGLNGRMGEQAVEQGRRLDGFATQLVEHRKGAGADALALRTETNAALAAATLAIKQLGEANERRQEDLRKAVEARLDALRIENAAKLEEMRVTVDEKLQGTLEARLGASFTTVNENLERVFKSVGEMQTIATGVGDLKRVLTNVKLRGSYGETTLGMLLEQVMTAEQYAQNVEVRPNSGQRVEYAIKMPGDGETPLWLPIDVKHPHEDYERLVAASERGDPAAVEEATRGLERTIRKCAADIGEKYVAPPHSTDFGIMFLPTEGLFAEVTRRPGLVDALQREHRVIVAGPTTLMATLVSLRMGFRSLAIQQRSSEVWQVLGAVKGEFGKFGDMLDKVSKKLGEAQNVVESAGVRRRAVDRRLRAVEALPEAAARDVLALAADDLVEDDEVV